MKTALGFLIAAQILAMPANMVNTMNYQEPETVMEYNDEAGPTRQEQFKWYYRMYNGHQQMRLWSVTYGYWVTDWIDC